MKIEIPDNMTVLNRSEDQGDYLNRVTDITHEKVDDSFQENPIILNVLPDSQTGNA